jgi:hypothetical protein
MRESQVEKHLVEQVEGTGGLVRKLQWVGRRSAPDRLVGWPWEKLNKESKFTPNALIETKRPKGKARDDQKREHERLRAIGFDVRVLDTIEAVDAFVKEMTS